MRIVFMGTPDFAVPCLDALVHNKYDVVGVVTQPDKPFGRKQSELKAPPVKEAAIRHGITAILQPAKVRTPDFLESIRALEPDLIVTAAYGRILTKNVLDVPRLGCINVHASLLPQYRGAAPIQWAVINGDEKTGVTTMYMDEGMDTGDILMTREVPIPPDMTSGELFDELKSIGAEVLLETLKALEKGSLERTPQDNSKAVNVPMVTKELGLIDWNRKAAEVHNLVRGTNPWPGAFTYYKGSRMKIWKTAVIDCHSEAYAGRPENIGMPINQADQISGINQAIQVKQAKPGTIMKILKDGLIVAAGDGCLRILELQFDNCRRMNACECGHNMDEGEILG